VQLDDETAVRPAVTNVGVRPTLEVAGPLVVESHVLDFAGDVYGRPVRLFFFDRLRDERRFGSAGELATQIGPRRRCRAAVVRRRADGARRGGA